MQTYLSRRCSISENINNFFFGASRSLFEDAEKKIFKLDITRFYLQRNKQTEKYIKREINNDWKPSLDICFCVSSDGNEMMSLPQV